MTATPSARSALFGHVRAVFLLGSSVLLAAVLPLVSIPVVSHRFGEQGLAVVAIAISIGGGASVLIDLGWVVIGPQRVADTSSDRAGTYRAALAMRLTSAAVFVPLAAGAAAVLAPSAPGTAALLAVGAAGAGLLPTWYFTGVARPVVVLLTDGLPRMVSVLAAMIGIALGGPLWWYGAALVLAVGVALTVGGALVHGRSMPSRHDWRAVPRRLHGQRHLIGARAVAMTYVSLPAALIGSVAPGAVAVYSLVDRPLRLATTVAGAVPARLASWLGAVPSRIRARIPLAVVVNVVLGAVGAIAFRLVVPVLLPLLVPSDIVIPGSVQTVAAATVFVICANGGTLIALVALGRERVLAVATVIAAVVGIPGILVLSSVAGSTGACVAVLVAETAYGVWLAGCLIRAFRRTDTSDDVHLDTGSTDRVELLPR